jgi:hypothetical protein
MKKEVARGGRAGAIMSPFLLPRQRSANATDRRPARRPGGGSCGSGDATARHSAVRRRRLEVLGLADVAISAAANSMQPPPADDQPLENKTIVDFYPKKCKKCLKLPICVNCQTSTSDNSYKNRFKNVKNLSIAILCANYSK